MSFHNVGTINAKCSKCESTKFVIPDNPQPDSMITCASCEAEVGTYSAIQEAMKDEGRSILESKLKDTLKKWK